jgi:hypothetical protein
MDSNLIARLEQAADGYHFADSSIAKLLREAAAALRGAEDAPTALQREHDEMLAEYRQAANDISARLAAAERERDKWVDRFARISGRASAERARARVGAHHPTLCGGPAVCSWCAGERVGR